MIEFDDDAGSYVTQLIKIVFVVKMFSVDVVEER